MRNLAHDTLMNHTQFAGLTNPFTPSHLHRFIPSRLHAFTPSPYTPTPTPRARAHLGGQAAPRPPPFPQ
eukprot:1088190-Rhodomonas_salina.1